VGVYFVRRRLAMTTAHIPDHIELPSPAIEEVTNGVFGYIQLDGSWGLNNTGFIVGGDGVTAIDTCFTERRSRAFRDAIRSVSGLPVRALVNTHHHGDHTHGNFVFRPGGDDNRRSCAVRRSSRREWDEGALSGSRWGEIEVAPPFVTFDNRMTLFVDELRVELIPRRPARTNDVVVWLPERRVMFTGDVIFNNGTPFALMGSIAGWLEALDRLRSLGAERMVPGHGAVCGPGSSMTLRNTLCSSRRSREKGSGGRLALETARDTDLGRFSEWLDQERLVGNLHQAYSELRREPRGTPLALPQAVADMVAYNGGQMPRCLA
jgi:cyclase